MECQKAETSAMKNEYVLGLFQKDSPTGSSMCYGTIVHVLV